MDKVITTALLIIAGVVVTVMLYNVVYPAVIRSGDALVGRQRRIDDRLSSQIEIIHTAPEDSVCHDVGEDQYWQNVFVWVKNVGSSRITAIERCDVFFGPDGNFSRISYGEGGPFCGDGGQHWTFGVEGDETDKWKPTATLQITVTYNVDDENGLSSEEVHYVKVVLPNGISDDDYFTPSPTPTP